jgi:hypothetical protein
MHVRNFSPERGSFLSAPQGGRRILSEGDGSGTWRRLRTGQGIGNAFGKLSQDQDLADEIKNGVAADYLRGERLASSGRNGQRTPKELIEKARNIKSPVGKGTGDSDHVEPWPRKKRAARDLTFVVEFKDKVTADERIICVVTVSWVEYSPRSQK